MDWLIAIIMNGLEGAPAPVRWIAALILPAIVTAPILGAIIKPLLRKAWPWLKEKTPPALWPAVAAVVGIFLNLLAQYGINISPEDIGMAQVLVGAVAGAVGAPLVRETFKPKVRKAA